MALTINGQQDAATEHSKHCCKLARGRGSKGAATTTGQGKQVAITTATTTTTTAQKRAQKNYEKLISARRQTVFFFSLREKERERSGKGGHRQTHGK